MSKLSYEIIIQCEDQDVPRGISPNSCQTIGHDSTNSKVRYDTPQYPCLCLKEPLKRVCSNVQVPTINKYPICVSSNTYGYLGPCFYVHIIQKIESALAITQEMELLPTNSTIYFLSLFLYEKYNEITRFGPIVY